MKIKLLLLACLASAASAQPSYTTISDTIYTPVAGVLFSGQVQISSAVPLVATGSVAIAQWQQVFPVSNGALRVRVVPNDTLTQANTSYVFRFTPAGGGQPWNEYCQIPTSGSPLKLSDVCATTPYSPPSGTSAGGILSGSYPNPTCPTCEVTGHKDATNGYPGLVGGKVAIGAIPTGTTGATVPFGNDSRFSDARAPTVHAATHGPLGSDPLSGLAESQVAGLPSDLAAKVPVSDVGVTVASLDLGGKVPLGQIPAVPVPTLDASALADGTYCLSVTSHVFSVVTCTGGGGGGGLSWAALTNLQWTSLTDGQWTSIGN